MMLYRSLVLGLLGALLLLQAQRPRYERAFVASAPPDRGATIVDVSRKALGAGADLMPALGLRPGERVAAIGDHPVIDSVEVAATIAAAAHGEFVDLDVRRGDAARRVLVLVH